MSPPRDDRDRPGLDALSVLDRSGSRRYVYPADARGRFTRLKPFVYLALVAVYVAMPLVHINGQPALWIDLPRRHFYVFGATFNAQDFYLAFFVFSAIGFALIVLAALFGRIWCGWACPQTVFLDGFFRRVERWIEGPAAERQRLAAGPWTSEKIVKKLSKHAIYLVLATLIAHVFLAYFASADGLAAMITEGPAAHPSTFVWALVLTLVFYGNFWWFREQLCIVICPYGRLQSALQDKDTINVVYDRVRGEPRGKAKEKVAKSLGDCVDCGRCVAVCPTRIDIRHGHQLECIGCAYCIDACDEVMTKLGRVRGLIRYDSQRAVEEKRRRFWRPRVFFYLFMGVLGLAVAALVVSGHASFEAEVLRSSGAPFAVLDDAVENQLRVHVVNKHGAPGTIRIAATGAGARWVSLPQPEVRLEPFADHDLPVLVRVPRSEWQRGLVVELDAIDSLSEEPLHLKVDVLGPHRLATPKAHAP